MNGGFNETCIRELRCIAGRPDQSTVPCCRANLTFLDIRTDCAASFGGPRSRSRRHNTHRICQAAHIILRIWKVEFPVSSLAQRKGIQDNIIIVRQTLWPIVRSALFLARPIRTAEVSATVQCSREGGAVTGWTPSANSACERQWRRRGCSAAVPPVSLVVVIHFVGSTIIRWLMS